MNQIEQIKEAVRQYLETGEGEISHEMGARLVLTNFIPEKGICETRAERANGTYGYALWHLGSDCASEWKELPTSHGWSIVSSAQGQCPNFSFLDGAENGA